MNSGPIVAISRESPDDLGIGMDCITIGMKAIRNELVTVRFYLRNHGTTAVYYRWRLRKKKLPEDSNNEKRHHFIVV